MKEEKIMILAFSQFLSWLPRIKNIKPFFKHFTR
jgi:hypothetical protein